MTYADQTLQALSKPHASLSIKDIVKLTGMNNGYSAIYDLRQQGHSIIDVKCKNDNTGKYFNRYMLARKF